MRPGNPIGCRIAALAVSLSVVALSACGGADEPAELDLESGNTAPVDEPAEPEVPEEPEEFVEYFIGLVNEARATTDPEPYLAYSHPDCKACNGIAEVLRNMATEGGHYDGYTLEVVDEIYLIETTDPPLYAAILQHDDFERVSEDGADPEVVEAKTIANEFQLEEGEDGWIVREWTTLADG